MFQRPANFPHHGQRISKVGRHGRLASAPLHSPAPHQNPSQTSPIRRHHTECKSLCAGCRLPACLSLLRLPVVCADLALRLSTCCNHESELQHWRPEHVRADPRCAAAGLVAGAHDVTPSGSEALQRTCARAAGSGQAGCAECVRDCGGRDEAARPFSGAIRLPVHPSCTHRRL